MILSGKTYSKNPWLAMIPKNESPDGFAGKYIPRGYGDVKSGKIGGSCNANPEVSKGTKEPLTP
jgi:hypothetical protein